MAAMPLADAGLRMGSSLCPTWGPGFERPGTLCNPPQLLLKRCFFARRLSLKSDRDRRNEHCSLIPSLVRTCRLPLCSSNQLASFSRSIPRSLIVDSLNGASRSSTPDVPTSSRLIGARNCDSYTSATVVGLGLVACSLLCPEASLAGGTESSFANVMTFAGAEPSNALSLPTWLIHVASVVEWVTAMALVWKYGDTKGNSAWKGLTWGMVPLLGGAMCACTWHFFYNAESLEILVVLQAFLTILGNFTMWAAAYRIWKLSKERVTVD